VVSDAATLVAPSAADIDRLAREALARMPDWVRARLGGLVLLVEELADDDMLADLDIDDPFELTGLYDGLGGEDPGDAPPAGPTG
jgi:predicted Zn-dependent protease with MMP-like domain